MTDARLAAERLATAARCEIPHQFLQVSGRALYSPASTLTSGSRFYFLGANPGEAPVSLQLHSTLTVEADLQRLEANLLSEHGYLDEEWKNFLPGCAPIQMRGQQVFSLLSDGSLPGGKDLLRLTPASNFILQRSPDLNVLRQRTGASTAELAKIYWPFHQAVIRETHCEVVITHAISIARQLAQVLGLGEGQRRSSGWGGTLANCYAWRLREGPMLLAIPNLSRYMPDGPRRSALKSFFQEFALAHTP